MSSHRLRSRHTSGRTFLTPQGNERHDFVRDGNLLSARVAILLMVCAARNLRWVLEQPSASILPDMPWFQKLWDQIQAWTSGSQFNVLLGVCLVEPLPPTLAIDLWWEAWRTTFWMGKFGSASPKMHVIWSNDFGFLEMVHARAGHMPRSEQKEKSEKLVKTYFDKQGNRRHVGIKNKLKNSQTLRLDLDWLFSFYYIPCKTIFLSNCQHPSSYGPCIVNLKDVS